MEQIQPLLPYIVPTLTALVAWFAGARMRNNSNIVKMQETIDMLVTKNAELYEEIAELRAIIEKNKKPNE